MPEVANPLPKSAVEVAAISRANSTPLPGELSEAFGSCSTKIHGYTLRPVVAADYIIFEMLSSPMKEHMLKTEGEQVPTSSVEVMELCYQFTHDADEVYTLIDEQGRKAFTRKAISSIGRLTPQQFKELADAIGQHVSKANSTMLSYSSKQEAKAGEVNFTPATGSQKMD